MASINLDNLAKPRNIAKKPYFTYADVQVDFKFDNTQQAALYSNLKNKDLVGDYNLGAIRNSIINIFTTFPGDKILTPTFGLNLNQFLFDPCSTDTAQLIGDEIKNQLVRQEPRIVVNKVRVVAQPSQSQYDITLNIAVPFINNNNTLQIRATLNSTGIDFYS